MELQYRVKAYRIVGYSAIVFSMAAVVAVCIALPAVFSFVKLLKHNMYKEALACRVGFIPNFPRPFVVYARVAQSKEGPAVACTRSLVPGSDFPPRTAKPSMLLASVNRCRTYLERPKY